MVAGNLQDYNMVAPSLLYDCRASSRLLYGRLDCNMVAHSASTLPLGVSTFLLGTQLIANFSAPLFLLHLVIARV